MSWSSQVRDLNDEDDAVVELCFRSHDNIARMGQLALHSDCKWPILLLFDATNERGQIARDIFDTFERLLELSDKVKDCLERFSIYIDILDVTGLLGNRLTLFYQEIIIFCLKAADAYNRSKASEYLEG